MLLRHWAGVPSGVLIVSDYFWARAWCFIARCILYMLLCHWAGVPSGVLVVSDFSELECDFFALCIICMYMCMCISKMYWKYSTDTICNKRDESLFSFPVYMYVYIYLLLCHWAGVPSGVTESKLSSELHDFSLLIVFFFLWVFLSTELDTFALVSYTWLVVLYTSSSQIISELELNLFAHFIYLCCFVVQSFMLSFYLSYFFCLGLFLRKELALLLLYCILIYVFCVGAGCPHGVTDSGLSSELYGMLYIAYNSLSQGNSELRAWRFRSLYRIQLCCRSYLNQKLLCSVCTSYTIFLKDFWVQSLIYSLCV